MGGGNREGEEGGRGWEEESGKSRVTDEVVVGEGGRGGGGR